MKVRLAIVALACFAHAAPAAEPSEQDKARGARTVADALKQMQATQGSQPSVEVRRKVAQRLGDCIAKDKKLHAWAVIFLLSGKQSDGSQALGEKCFGKAVAPFTSLYGYWGGLVQGYFPTPVLRSLVADGLVRVDLQAGGPSDFSGVPPLLPSPLAVNGAETSAKPSVADKLGECAARLSPEGIRQLALTDVTTDEEMTAIRGLVPTFSQCLPPGAQLAFEPGALRDASVTAYARLAFTLSAKSR